MRALDGLRVVSFSTTLAGVQTAQLFADFGADVVDAEPPGGSPLRGQPAWPFWARGTRSVRLDLREERDRAVARELAVGADVLIESWRPGVAERFGLGYEDLSPANPRLVYGSVTGFGRTGPLRDVKGYEGVVMAKIGALGSVTTARRGAPSFVATPAASFSASQTLLQGLLAALYERESSGRGQRVDTSLVQAITAHDCWNWLVRLVAARYPSAFTAVPMNDEFARVPNSPLSYRLLVALTKDGRWLQFSQTSERLWVAFLQAADLDFLRTDPYWKDIFEAGQGAKRDEFWTILLEKVKSKTVAEWYEIFDTHPDVFAEIFRRGNELLDHPQVVHDRQVVTVDDPRLGPVRQMGPLVAMHATPADVTRPAPDLDADGDQLRADPRRGRLPPVPSGAASTRPPLDGVTILELGTYYAGPFGATLLAELGARVIKIEQADGDPMRWIMPFPEVGGVKVLSGKESVCIDFHQAEGRELVYELVRRSDAVLRTFRGGVAERLGLDDATLLAINPDLVYLNAPGFGLDGPYGHRPAYAPTIGAGGGQAGRNLGPTMVESPDLTIEETKDNALRMAGAAMSGSNPDALSALAVATSLLLGLLAKRRGAPGQAMLTTMLNTMGHTLSEDMVDYHGRAPTRAVDEQIYGFGPLYRLYETAEGWVFLAVTNAAEWVALVDSMDAHGVSLRDLEPDYSDTPDTPLAARLTDAFRRRRAHEWEKDLLAADVACVVVETGPSEAVLMEGSPPLGEQLGFLTRQEHAVVGEYLRMTPLASLSRTPGVAPGAPLLGADTEKVLRELGQGDDDIAGLRARGVIPG